jgi:hypothetical protein
MQSVPITTDVVSSNLDQGEVYNIRPLQFNSLFDVNFFFQSQEGIRQTDKTLKIKQDEFHRIFFCINMQLCEYAITKTNTGYRMA